MSYVNKKTRVFRTEEDAAGEVVRKRSESRLKTYGSAFDVRSWCIVNEDRRQHILELLKIRDLKGLSLGKYIPIEVLIDTLLANKDADIEKLKKQLDQLKKLLDAYEKLDLTDEQRRQIEALKSRMGRLSGVGFGDDNKGASKGKKPRFDDAASGLKKGARKLPDGTIVYDDSDGGRRKAKRLPDGTIVYVSDDEDADGKKKSNLFGVEKGRLLPDGRVVYDDDDNGRRKPRKLSDGTIVYESVDDLTLKKKGGKRLSDGRIVYDNDDNGRRKAITLPDGTVVYVSDTNIPSSMKGDADWKSRGGRKLADGTIVYDDDDGGRRVRVVLPDGTVVYMDPCVCEPKESECSCDDNVDEKDILCTCGPNENDRFANSKMRDTIGQSSAGTRESPDALATDICRSPSICSRASATARESPNTRSPSARSPTGRSLSGTRESPDGRGSAASGPAVRTLGVKESPDICRSPSICSRTSATARESPKTRSPSSRSPTGRSLSGASPERQSLGTGGRESPDRCRSPSICSRSSATARESPKTRSPSPRSPSRGSGPSQVSGSRGSGVSRGSNISTGSGKSAEAVPIGEIFKQLKKNYLHLLTF